MCHEKLIHDFFRLDPRILENRVGKQKLPLKVEEDKYVNKVILLIVTAPRL